jgi:hypothetical protein
VPELEVRERPPSTLRNIDSGPRKESELEVREHPPSTLRNVDGGPPGGARAGALGAPIINDKKHRQRAPERCQSW